MSLFAIENLLVAIFSLVLTFIVFKYAQNLTHRIWGFFNLAISVWAVAMFLVGISQTEYQAILAWKFAFTAVPFIGVFYYHFVHSYCKLKRIFVYIFNYLFAISFASLSVFTNQFVYAAPLNVNSIFYSHENLISLFSLFFSIWVVIVLVSFYEFYIYLKKSTGLLRIQSLFMFWSMVIGFTGGVSTVLPSYGLNFYPCFQFSIIFYILFTSYAIFKHELIPLDVVIKKSLFYSSMVTSVTLLYLVGIVVFQKLFESLLGLKGLVGSFAALIVIGIIFIPLKNKIQSLIDNYILKKSPVEIAIQNETLLVEVAKTEKLRSIANMASMLIHEIKNPLGNLIAYTETLKSKKNEPEYVDQYQQLVTNEIERINILLNEVLDYAKPSEPRLKEINPNKIIDQIIMLVQSKCDLSNIKVIFNSNTDKNILADSNLILQAVLNLVLNAIDAMPQGGTLTITTLTSVEYSFDLSNPNKSGKELYTIKISDSGCGIDKKDLTSIFEPFFTKKKSGTGLGLPITQGIIERHGGRIEVNSVLNEGTTFNIILGKNESKIS